MMKGFHWLGKFPPSSSDSNIWGKLYYLSSSSPLCFQSFLGCYFGGANSVINRNYSSKTLGKNINGLDDAFSLYENMARMRPFPPAKQFGQLLSRVADLKEHSTVICLFKDLCTLGIASEYTMNVALRSYCLSNRTSCGFSILVPFFKRGCVPDATTFGTLLKGLFRENRIAEAHELCTKIVREGWCEVNDVIHGIVIDGLCRAGYPTMAVQLLGLTVKGGRSCTPGIKIYNRIIGELCKCGRTDAALELFDEISAKGIRRPDVVTYASLMRGLCNSSRWREVQILFKDMEDRKVSPNLVTFNALIDALCKQGLVFEAEDALHSMEQKGVVPDIVSYSTLMDGYCLEGCVYEAKELFYSMANNNVAPDNFCLSILMSGYCKSLELDHAMHIYAEMGRKGVKPNVAVCNTLLRALFEEGRCTHALLFYNEMRSVGPEPNMYTECAMLEGLCRNGLSANAHPRMEALYEKGELHIAHFNIVLDDIWKNNGLLAESHFNRLPSIGLEPDVVTFNIMIKGYCQCGDIEQAKDLVLKMEQVGLLPDVITYNTIVRGHLASGQYPAAAEVVEEMTSRGFALDSSTLALLLDLKRKNLAISKLIQVVF